MSADRHGERLARTMTSIGEAGLRGLLVTPGATLGYLTGYAPMPLERLTVLALAAGRDPVMIVPMLERPSALASPAGEAMEIVGWTDAEDPYALTAGLLGPAHGRDTAGAFAISDAAWASHVLGRAEHDQRAGTPHAGYSGGRTHRLEPQLHRRCD